VSAENYQVRGGADVDRGMNGYVFMYEAEMYCEV
jgi:hypothetical protein